MDAKKKKPQVGQHVQQIHEMEFSQNMRISLPSNYISRIVDKTKAHDTF